MNVVPGIGLPLCFLLLVLLLQQDKKKRKKQIVTIVFACIAIVQNSIMLMGNNAEKCQDNANGVNNEYIFGMCDMAGIMLIYTAWAATLCWCCQSFDLFAKVVLSWHTDKWVGIYFCIIFLISLGPALYTIIRGLYG